MENFMKLVIAAMNPRWVSGFSRTNRYTSSVPSFRDRVTTRVFVNFSQSSLLHILNFDIWDQGHYDSPPVWLKWEAMAFRYST